MLEYPLIFGLGVLTGVVGGAAVLLIVAHAERETYDR